MGRRKMGGDGKDTKGDGEEDSGTESKHKQRSCPRRTGMVVHEIQERYAQIEVLVAAHTDG